MSLDFSSPRDVCRRLATLHVEGVRRDATIESLVQAQREDDRELDRLRRLLLAMAPDGTSLKVAEVPDPSRSYTTTTVALIVEDRMVTCHELADLHTLDDLLPEEVDAALEPAVVDPRIALETALMDLRDSEDETACWDMIGRTPAGCCVP